MGRCYEFGVEIHAGCEQAMVVTEKGGACECRDCGTLCRGRFGGCGAVISVPARVPPAAPAWALPGAGRQAAREDSRTTTRGSQLGDLPGPTPSAVPPARRSASPV